MLWAVIDASNHCVVIGAGAVFAHCLLSLVGRHTRIFVLFWVNLLVLRTFGLRGTQKAFLLEHAIFLLLATRDVALTCMSNLRGRCLQVKLMF